jgi:hypothetical protein
VVDRTTHVEEWTSSRRSRCCVGYVLCQLCTSNSSSISVLLRWSSSILGVSKYHIQALTEGSNATHQNVMIGNMEWLRIKVFTLMQKRENPKSLAQVWICSRHLLC